MRAVSAVLLMMVLAGCTTGTAPSAAPSTPGAPVAGSPSAAAPSADASPADQIDLAGQDICTLLDIGTVQAITGESVGFSTDGRSDASSAACFWGAAVAGVPAFVEVRVFRTRDGLSTWEPPRWGSPSDSPRPSTCTFVPVPGLGTEAKGATCPPDPQGNPQRRIWLAVTDRGLIVTVEVNEPSRALAPSDLAEAFEAVWLGLQ